ncbi:SRPBCC domain-containing protein [Natrinema halophilum]|uniref:SRPBCC domain-containing protein n=1 Tax=Natrinema halophilum TaxID=1699371 RepID=A0A7D5KC35_9EURY|nr:SRPBCC domain-containing protein [Natrinema halophilum]QLG48281.1 SRPBCC domain-containing protein [Natrinema halophilum]
MEEVEVFVEIDAPPPDVWEALRSFESYPEWNPASRRIEGVVVDPGIERPPAAPSGRGRRTIESSVVAVEPHRRLAWLDRFVVPFAFDRYHEFHLEPITDSGRFTSEPLSDGSRRTRLLQRETVRGALVPFAFDHDRVERAFVEMNEAIAARAERRASPTI